MKSKTYSPKEVARQAAKISFLRHLHINAHFYSALFSSVACGAVAMLLISRLATFWSLQGVFFISAFVLLGAATAIALRFFLKCYCDQFHLGVDHSWKVTMTSIYAGFIATVAMVIAGSWLLQEAGVLGKSGEEAPCTFKSK